jgi:hypothetical protein
MEDRIKKIIKAMSKEDAIELLLQEMNTTAKRNIVIKYEYRMRRELQPDRTARDIKYDLSAEFDPAINTNSDHSGLSLSQIDRIVKNA